MRTSLSQRRITSAAAAATPSSSMQNSYNSSSSRRNMRLRRARNKQPSAHALHDSDEDGFSTEESDYPTSPRIDRFNNNQLLPGMRDNNGNSNNDRGTHSSGAEESDGGWSDESGKNSVTDLGSTGVTKSSSSPATSYNQTSSSSPAAANRSAYASMMQQQNSKDYCTRYDSEKPDPMEMDASDDESFSHSALGMGSYLNKTSSPNGGGTGIGGSIVVGPYQQRRSSLEAPAVIETGPAVMSPPGRGGGGPPRILTTTNLIGLQSIGSPGGGNEHQGLNTRSISPLGDDDDDDDDDDDMGRPPTLLSPMHTTSGKNDISGPAAGYFGYRHIESKGQPREQPFIAPRPPTPEQQSTPPPTVQVDPNPTPAVVVPHKYGLGAFSLTNNGNGRQRSLDPLPNSANTPPEHESPSENRTYTSSSLEQKQGMENKNDPRFGNGDGDNSRRGGFRPPPARYSTDSEAAFRSVNNNRTSIMPAHPPSNTIKPTGSSSSGSMDDNDVYVENEANNIGNKNNNNDRGGSTRNISPSPAAAAAAAAAEDRSPTPNTYADRRPRSPSPSPSASGSRTSKSRTPTSHFQDEGVSPGNGRGGGGDPPSPPGSPYGYDRDYSNEIRSRSGSPPPRDRNLPPIVVGGSRSGSAASLDDDDYKAEGHRGSRSRTGRTTRSTRSHDTMSFSEREAKRSRKTITCLVIGLACALISLAALAGGLFGALYFGNDDDNSPDDNASAPKTIPPEDSPEATIAPSYPSYPVGPFPNATQTPGPGNEAPTAAPLEPLEITNQALFDLVASASVDGGAAIMVTRSPQNMAYRWLQNEDTLTIAGGVSPANSTGGGSGGGRRRHLRQQLQQQQQQHRQLLRNERIIQRYAMACFYYGAGGPGWIRDGWLNGTVNECKWPIDTPSDINCGTESNIVSIEFTNNRLSGQLVPELGLLTKLVKLVIRNNETEASLTGAIPTELKALKAMRSLEISGNEFTQPLPDNLFDGWKAATVIDLSNNGLPGAIPGSIGQLSNCTQFIASKNRLTGDIPESIIKMTSLEEWDISENNITGAVTSEMCVALTTVPTKAIVDCDKVTCDCCEPCGEDGGVGIRR